jgi:hypothetical protein
MTEVIRIGAEAEPAKKPPTTPLRYLPNRMDAQACLILIERIHPTLTAASIRAAGKMLDLGEIDVCLEHTELSTTDKISFKSALAEFGLIPRGKRMGS